MSVAALALLNPWILAALASLPVLYWLLRTVPPRPKQILFPATRILVGLENKEKTPAKTPWWLLLIRLLAATLIILALAKPVLNPDKQYSLAGDGPLVLVIDNGWSAAKGWQQRLASAERLIDEAQSNRRAVIIVETAHAAQTRTMKLESPGDARATLQSLLPQPFAPNRLAALKQLQKTLKDSAEKPPAIVWLSDGIDHNGNSREFMDGLAAASDGGSLTIVSDQAGQEPLALAAELGKSGTLIAKVMRTNGPARAGKVFALSARGQKLGAADFALGKSASSANIEFALPLELRNQVARIELAEGQSAGAVHLLDGRSQWQRVGMISGESQEQAQPLLAPLYYIQKAIKPFAEVIKPKDLNMLEGIETILEQNASVLVLADIGKLTGEMRDNISDWVNRGGVLIRFAGPRLEAGGDELLPVALRTGGRTLGGALSWSTPQPLAEFDQESIFAGLEIPKDVTINRQVLADPARIGETVKVWARLADGTPLVTAQARGGGQVVLFHVTANTDWSNLPISGLFVEMLRRITSLGSLSGTSVTSNDTDTLTAAQTTTDQQADNLLPIQNLDGKGILRQPPPTAEGFSASLFASIKASAKHPPGYYGPASAPRAVNVIDAKTELMELPALPSGSQRLVYEAQAATPLAPWLLSAALALVFIDIIAVLILAGLAGSWLGRRASSANRQPTSAAAILLACGLVSAGITSIPMDTADAGAFRRRGPVEKGPKLDGQDGIVQRATSKVTLAYVKTGDDAVDEISQAGLSGLSRVLAARTAIEPGEPLSVDIIKDEVTFFPLLYWPITKNARTLPEKTLAKIDAFMKQGGLIIFDTRDYGTGLTGTQLSGQNGAALKRLLGSLDVPRLQILPPGHVLTKSFYLLQSFPGRWDGGELWVDANTATATASRQARRADGVTSIMITSNDFAGAWALDARGRPLYPTVPGGERQRELSLRSGVNIVMHALTGNYKADQVHVPALLERLGQ